MVPLGRIWSSFTGFWSEKSSISKAYFLEIRGPRKTHLQQCEELPPPPSPRHRHPWRSSPPKFTTRGISPAPPSQLFVLFGCKGGRHEIHVTVSLVRPGTSAAPPPSRCLPLAGIPGLRQWPTNPQLRRTQLFPYPTANLPSTFPLRAAPLTSINAAVFRGRGRLKGIAPCF